MNIPETRYAQSDGVNIAYQTFGDGAHDIVCVPGWFTNVEATWEDPHKTRSYDRLASFSRAILFDMRVAGPRDLVTDRGIEFTEHGEHALRGISDSWRLYAARP